MKKYLLYATALALSLLPASAQADLLFGGFDFATTVSTGQLTVGGPIPAGNQPQNIVCIICGTNQPQQDSTGAGPFPYNNYQQGGNIVQFLASSTSTFAANGHGDQLANNTLGTGYLQSFLLAYAIANNAINLNVGIDVNTATGQGAEILNRFAVVDVANKTLLADTGVINMALPTLNNGSGFPDYTISGFDINRGDINANTQIGFLALWSNASDGAESFFLTPVAVPGPIAGAGLPGLIAACFGLFGLNKWRRRRNTHGLPATA